MTKKRIIYWIFFGAVLLYLTLLTVSNRIPPNSLFLCGEYQATLSYTPHLETLYENIDFSKPSNLFSCPGCILFYPYSWLYSTTYFTYLSIGETMNLNPFVFYIASGILLQILATYSLIRFGLGKRNLKFQYVLLVSFLLYTPVYKAQLLCSGTSYAINHTIVILFISFLLYIFRDIKSFTTNKLLLLTGIANLLILLILTLGINYLPILFYSAIILLGFNIKNIFSNLKKFSIIGFTTVTTFILLNISWIRNIGEYEFKKSFLAPVNNETFLDAVTGRYFISLNIHPTVPIIFCIFLLLTIVVHIYYKSKSIRLLLLAYALIVILLMGSNSPYNLYLFIFDNFPLMSSIRSSHRLYAFVFMFQIILTYTAIETLKGKLKTAYITLFSILLLLNVYTSVKQLQQHVIFTTIPKEYTEIVEYIETNHPNESVLYLPINSSSYLYGNYDWYDQRKLTHNPYVYIDLMQSLLYLKNNIQIFNWYNYEPNDYHLNRLTNLYISKSEMAAINLSERIENIKPTLIIDDNYHLKREEYNNLLLENYQEIKTFGKIKLYKRVAEINCEKYYGNVIIDRKEVCFDYYNPTFLNNKTIQEFIFETKPSKTWELGQLVRSDKVHSELIYSQNARTHLTNSAIIFNTDTIEIVNPENNNEPTEFQQFYSTNNNGYLLFEGIHIPNESVKFSEIIIRYNNNIKNVTINNSSKFTLYVVSLENLNHSPIKVYATGGYTLLSKPVLLSELQYSKFLNLAEKTILRIEP